ncbi:MAG: glycosyltransferase [Rhodothermaceae bacterium]
MKVLIITPRIPYPPHRGDKLKIFNLASFLKKNHQVKILTFSQGKDDAKNAEILKEKGFDVEFVNLSIVQSVLSVMLAVFSSIPFQAAYFKSGKMKKLISDNVQNTSYDLVYFHLIRSAQYADEIKNFGTKKIIDYTDSVSLYLSRYIKILKNPLRKLFFFWELKRIEKYETIGNKFDNVYVCSETDKKNLRERIEENKIKILSNGVDLTTFKPKEVPVENNRIIFTGNMPYFPNYDAVGHFVKDIYPHILKQKPDSKFYIVGQKPPAFIKEMENENIVVTGFVDDIREEYLKSVVNIAPIRFGAGTLNKIIESLVLGIPVVASALSVAGMSPELKKYVLVAESEIYFAEKVVAVLAEPEKFKSELIAARNDIIEMLDWNNILKKFETELVSLVKE